MLRAIDKAESHVLLEFYIMESGDVADQFIDAFLRAAERQVNVQILLDDFGSGVLLAADRERLTDGGVRLAFYNPLRFELFGQKLKNNLFRTHRKFMIIDGRSVFVGGTGISDSFIGENAWRDSMLEVSGSTALDWQSLFASSMRRWSGPIEVPAPVASLAVHKRWLGVAADLCGKIRQRRTGTAARWNSCFRNESNGASRGGIVDELDSI